MMKIHVMRRARLVLRNLKASGMLLDHTSFSVRFLSEPSLVKACVRIPLMRNSWLRFSRASWPDHVSSKKTG
jgi:hypothetical protein